MKVNLIQKDAKAALVEYAIDGIPYRRVIARQDYDHNTKEVDDEVLELGIEYGDPWEELLQDLPPVDPEAIALELRKVGIWTLDDAKRNTNRVVSALMTAFGLHLGYILSLDLPGKE